MKNIQYIIDETGAKKAVILNLDKCAELWEDIHDILIARRRAKEPRESLNKVKKHLIRAGKLNG